MSGSAGPVPLQPGTVVDGFRLEEHLHQGGMANLWRVTHPDHAQPMLMKPRSCRLLYGSSSMRM